MRRFIKSHPIRSSLTFLGIIIVLSITATCLALFTGSKSSTTIVTSTPTRSSFVTTRVRMRDGIHLVVDYFSIPDTIARPVILEITPYGRGPLSNNYRYEAPEWMERGFIFVIAESRGTGDSEGEMSFLSTEGPDGYDLIEWIAVQPWCNGRIGMRGSSYTGTNQWFIAREQPPHLFCITPSATAGRQMEDIPYLNGAFAIGWAVNWINNSLKVLQPDPTGPVHANATTWLQHRPLRTMDHFATGRTLKLYQTFLDHPTLDDYWRALDFLPNDFAKIQIPSMAFTGWFDGTMFGTIWRFQQARQYALQPDEHFLIVGPYTHMNAPDGGYDFQTGKPMLSVGDLPLPMIAIIPGFNMTYEFFDWCLRNGSRPVWPPIRTFVTGSNQWMSLDRLPPVQSQEKSFVLATHGRLLSETNMTSGYDQYSYDPEHPLIISNYEKPLSLPVDVNPLLDRNDLLVYTTDILQQPLTVLGDVFIELKISSSAVDTDFVAILMDVTPDGRSIKLGSKTANQIRTRYRNGYDREILMTPEQIYGIRIDIHEIGHTFAIGHRIRLAITSSFFPWISANPNTGAPIDTDQQVPICANQTIFYDSMQPSRLILPIVDHASFDLTESIE